MRNMRKLIAAAALIAVAGCQTTTEPENREITGSWVSRSFPGGEIRMTLAETAREVRGAGAWLTPTDAHAFRATGAAAVDEVSLLFDFDGRVDVSFQGFFEDDDVVTGHLTGDGLRREPVTFDRVDLED